MSLYKRGNVWWVRFTTPSGREIRETTSTSDRRQAQEYHDRRKADFWRISQLGERPRHTWQDAVVRWHDLRHTWASWHVQAGTPLLALKELGGWSSIDMVMRYAHLAPDHLAEHAERISGPRLVRTNSGTSSDKSAASK